MQLGGNGGASRRRFPLVAFEGGLSHFVSQEDLGRLSHRKCPAASAAGSGVDLDAEVVSQAQPFLSQDSRFMNVDTWRAAAML